MSKNVARRRDPIKLTRRSGRWSIEFTRLVAVDDHLMRPERHQVAATTDNLRAVAPSCPPLRLEEAQALMNRTDDGSECAFELGGHGWAPVAEVARAESPAVLQKLTATVADLQGQLLLFRGLHDALLARVATLEALVKATGGRGAAPSSAATEHIRPLPSQGRRVPSRRDMIAVLQPAPRAPKFDLTLESLREPEASESPAAAATAGVPDGTTAFGLALPSRVEVVQCLQMLAADVTLGSDDRQRLGDPRGFCMARLVDDTEETVAVVLLDQRMGAELGGALLGLPKAARDEQAERGLAKDTLDGLNEICNNLAGLIKRANPRASTLLSPLEPWDAAKVPWLGTASRTLDFVTPNDGVLWLASR